jgi:hypothetical protein
VIDRKVPPGERPSGSDQLGGVFGDFEVIHLVHTSSRFGEVASIATVSSAGSVMFRHLCHFVEARWDD